jgi:hypothetical protein
MFAKVLFAAILLGALAEARPAGAETFIFEEPKVADVNLDWCRSLGEKCGQPAARAFCRANGYKRTTRFQMWVNPGVPTRTVADGDICDFPECDSFRFVECER